MSILEEPLAWAIEAATALRSASACSLVAREGPWSALIFPSTRNRNRANHPEFGKHLRTWPTGRNTILKQNSRSLKIYMDFILDGAPKAPPRNLKGTSEAPLRHLLGTSKAPLDPLGHLLGTSKALLEHLLGHLYGTS